jgi:hypothetical protein
MEADADDMPDRKTELADVGADLERIVGAICKVGISAALAAKLKELEQRQRALKAEIAATESVCAFPDRAAIESEWRTLIHTLGDLPKLLHTASEMEIARSSLRDYISEVRVDRHGIGRGDLRLQSVVAGGRFSTLPVMFNLAV